MEELTSTVGIDFFNPVCRRRYRTREARRLEGARWLGTRRPGPAGSLNAMKIATYTVNGVNGRLRPAHRPLDRLAPHASSGLDDVHLLRLLPDCLHYLAVQLYVHSVHVRAPMPEAAHSADPLAADLAREHRSIPVPPLRTDPCQISMPRSNSRSSTFHNDSGKRTYISTASRITSGDELK
jgi:hypothetical protein